MSLTIEQMREILDSIPVWVKERDGKKVEYSPTHFNRHPDAPIKWVWNDGSVVAICFMEQNYPNSWYAISEIRAALADHDRTDDVSDIRNHIAPTTIVSDKHLNEALKLNGLG